MEKKIFYSILSTLLLLQYGCASPTSEPKNELDDDMEMDRTILLIYAASNFGALVNTSVVEGKNIMKAVIADPKAAGDDAELTKMKAFVENVEKYEENDDLHSAIGTLFDLFTKMVFIFQGYDNEKPNTEHAAIDEILDASPMKKMGNEFNDGFEKYAVKLNTAIEKYLDGLTPEQKTKEQKLIDWQTKFKNEKQTEAKIVMLYSFIDLF